MNVSTKPLQHPSVRVHVFLGTGSTIFIIFPKAFVYNRGVTPENLLVLRKAWGTVERFGVRLAWIPIPANWTIARKLTGLAVLTCSTGCLGWQDEEPWCCMSTMFISYVGSSQFSFPNSHGPHSGRPGGVDGPCCGDSHVRLGPHGYIQVYGTFVPHFLIQSSQQWLRPSSLNVNIGAQSPWSASGQQDSAAWPVGPRPIPSPKCPVCGGCIWALLVTQGESPVRLNSLHLAPDMHVIL